MKKKASVRRDMHAERVAQLEARLRNEASIRRTAGVLVRDRRRNAASNTPREYERGEDYFRQVIRNSADRTNRASDELGRLRNGSKK